jgi:hypothetical protein
VVEGAQRVGPSDLEVEVVADPLVADGNLHAIARAVPEQCYFQPIRRSLRKLDPVAARRAPVECGVFHFSPPCVVCEDDEREPSEGTSVAEAVRIASAGGMFWFSRKTFVGS